MPEGGNLTTRLSKRRVRLTEDAPVYRRFTQQQLLAAAGSARKNAKQFLDDAEVLARTRSFAHACGLIALAEEEMAKTIILSMLSAGGFKDKRWLTLTSQHSNKHLVMSAVAMVDALRRLYRGAIPRRRGRQAGYAGTPVLVGLRDRTVDLLRHPHRLSAAFARLKRELGSLSRLSAIREAAFYVDLRNDAQQKVDASEFRRLLLMARSHYPGVKWSTNLGPEALEEAQRRRSNRAESERIAKFERWLFDEGGLARLRALLLDTEQKSFLATVSSYAEGLTAMRGTPQYKLVLGHFKAAADSFQRLVELMPTARRDQPSVESPPALPSAQVSSHGTESTLKQ